MTRTMTIAFACATALAMSATTGSARDGGERAASVSTLVVAASSGGRNATSRASRTFVAAKSADIFTVADAGTPGAGRNGCSRGACGLAVE